MAMGLLGLKVGMTQVYDDKGRMAPVTVLQVGPCPVLQVKKKGDKQSGSDSNGQGDGYGTKLGTHGNLLGAERSGRF